LVEGLFVKNVFKGLKCKILMAACRGAPQVL